MGDFLAPVTAVLVAVTVTTAVIGLVALDRQRLSGRPETTVLGWPLARVAWALAAAAIGLSVFRVLALV